MTETKNNTEPSRKKTVFRRITGIVGYVLIFLIAALFVFVIVFKANNRTMFVFGRAPVWVMTPSMEPTIPEKSYILIKKASADDIQVGDVIMFKSDDPALGGANNTHRVVEISEDKKTFVTKGDANVKVDDVPAKAENIVGVYERNLPVLTAIGRFMFSGIGIIITMTLIFAIIMAIYLPDIIRATQQKSKELEDKRQAHIEELVRAEVERLKRENEAASNVTDTAEDKTGADTVTASGDDTAPGENEETLKEPDPQEEKEEENDTSVKETTEDEQ